jgi:hypothetical protein
MVSVTLHRLCCSMALPARGALLAAACALLVSCAGETVLLDTPTGVTSLTSPGPVMPGGLAAPPPGMDSPIPTAGGPITGPTDLSGAYAGTAVPLNTGGGQCLQNQPVSGFRVRGNSVRFGGYRGRIAADGGLQMVNGSTWIVGRFDGPTFRGQIDMNQGFGNLVCTFMLTLQRVGP